MKRLKRILRWVVGLLVGIYVGLILLLSLPFFQNWLGSRISDILSDHLQSRVQVGRVQLGLTGRIIIDDIHVWDRQGHPMLTVARTGAKISILPLLHNGDININSAQLFGAHIHLYQENPEWAPNFQFLIDAFKSDEQESKPMPRISISSIQVRHTALTYDQRWKPDTPGHFNPGHLNISDLSLNAQLHSLTQDSLSLSLRRFSLKEHSGLTLTNVQAQVERKGDDIRLAEFSCSTPNSTVTIPELQMNLAGKHAQGILDFSFNPSDARAFHAPLARLTDPFIGHLTFDVDTLQAKIDDLTIRTDDGALNADIPEANINQLKDSIPWIDVKVKHLVFTPQIIQYIETLGPDVPDNLSRLIQTLGESQLQGDFSLQEGCGTAQMHITTALGQLDADGSLEKKKMSARVRTDGFQAGHILTALRQGETHTTDSISPIGNVALNLEADLTLPAPSIQGIKALIQAGRDRHANFPDGKITASIQEAVIKNYPYRNIHATVSHKGPHYDLQADAHDPALTFDFQGRAFFTPTENTLQGLLTVEHLRPQDMHLSQNGIQDLRLKMGVDLAGERLDNLTGDISIPHIILTDPEGTVTLTNMQLGSQADNDERHLTFQSPYLNLSADGQFQFTDLASYCQQTVHQWIPGIVQAPAKSFSPDSHADFLLQLIDPTPLERLAGIPLRLEDGPLRLQANMDSRRETLNLEVQAPTLGYGNEKLQDFSYSTQSSGSVMDTRIKARRIMKDVPVDILVGIGSDGKRLTTRIDWDNHHQPAYNGAIALQGNIQRQGDHLAIDGEVLPTTIQINDTTWNIQSTRLSYSDKILNVKDFRMTMEDGNRWLAVHGKASASETDTLRVNLRGIELAYIFQLVKVKPLTLAGQVSGDLYGTRLFDTPQARGHVIVPHMLFNSADMGTCDARLAWGITPGTLDIQARLEDPANGAWIDANGYLHLIKDPAQSLDLNFVCKRANAHFLQHYVGSIMEDIQGRVTGNVRVHGLFKEVELQGEADIEEAALTIPALNVRYHVQDEHVTLRPDGIQLTDVTGYDPQGSPGNLDHCGIINGEITYDHFRDMRYNFHVSGQNILAYNFPEYGDLPFCGVVYGTGDVTLTGRPGVTDIKINARPTPGTQLQYKVASPETLTQSKFITFIDRSAADDSNGEQSHTEEDEKPEGDMNITFNLDITPDAEMRLLMDPVAGDYISLYGNSRLQANYYNKGSFRMYGTYRVDHGLYRMSIQDVIRKDFQFRQGGTIVFGGSPFQADLGLQAIYTVPSVSLNDLSARGTFSNNTVRVNCIMNLGGKAGEPRVTFDFDIPNVNEDELRMVRSLISTEEERNLQVVYLLGIGRFYTYDYAGSQPQSSAAMNSLLSSTLSGQLNQMFTSMMGGNQNWNIGANLSTGDTGWSDMDVEGMLSGRLLNNRLLINGNFGYRDNPVAASNFIGDFDLQWILNRHGNLILKAYSETNDRYFTKSALTTQGVGLLLKKDFTRWSELLRFRKKAPHTTPATNKQEP